MLPIISFFVGLFLLVSFSLWLWYILTRPTRWARFTEIDHDFWVNCGLPVKWVGAGKEFERGRGLKVLVAFCIFMAGMLTITPFILLLILPRHG
jgi:hypothetical protein